MAAPYDLRPLSLGELLDRVFTLYRNHFALFVGVMAIPAAVQIPTNLYSRKTQFTTNFGLVGADRLR